LYGWIVVVIVLLTYVLALTLVRPVRQLHDVVVRFGQGDLSSRVRSRRKDELGELAHAFDRMADRIETLLTAERRLLQDVSHELRSPLARLRFALELSRSNPDSEAALARVDKEVDRLSTLVGELLDVTRAEGDPTARNLSAVDLAGLPQSVVDDCRIEAHAHDCEIQLNAPESLPWTGDRRRTFCETPSAIPPRERPCVWIWWRTRGKSSFGFATMVPVCPRSTRLDFSPVLSRGEGPEPHARRSGTRAFHCGARGSGTSWRDRGAKRESRFAR